MVEEDNRNLPGATGPATPATPQPRRPGAPHAPRRRWLRWTAGLLLALVLLVLALGAGAWIWAGRADSLAVVLQRAAAHLPAGQTLESREVSGSLRAGGRIGWLRWQGPTLAVEVRQAEIAWSLPELLKRRLVLPVLHVEDLSIARTGPPEPDTPTEPLQELTLPLDIDLPFQVDRIRWAGPPEVLVTGLAGRFRYQDGRHHLLVDGVDVAGGHYSLDATVQGAAPMQTQALLKGRLQPPLPEGAEPLTVGAGVHVSGTLAGEQARLSVAGAVRPADGSGMRADLLAEVAPWLPQPLLTARADLRQFDLARLLPGTPQTLLGGRIDAGPTAQGWQVHAALQNALPGPWDQQKLPVSQAEVAAAQQADGAWVISRALVEAGGGRLSAEGRWGPPVAVAATADPGTGTGTGTSSANRATPAAPATPASQTPPAPPASAAPGSVTAAAGEPATPPAPWQVTATLEGIQPGALHSQLAGPALSGKASASQQGEHLDFDLAITGQGAAPARPPVRTAGSRAAGRRPPGPDSALQALGLRALDASGRWSQGLLDLKRFELRAAEASADGVLQLRPDQQSGRGRLSASLPGASLNLDGALAPASGEGRARIALANAAALQRWITALPGLQSAFGGMSLDGSAQLDAQWRGGWQSAVRRWQQGGSGGGADLVLQASLSAPRLDIALPPSLSSTPVSGAAASGGNRPAVAIALSGLRAELSGSLAQASLSLQGSATSQGRRAELSTRASGGLDGPGRWRAVFNELRLQASDPALPGPWNIALDAPLSLQLRQARDQLGLEASAGSASLSGPAPGKVGIAWQPVSLLQSTGPGGKQQLRLRSSGRLQGLPMAWAQLFSAGGKDALAELGLAGNLVFDGSWDVDAGDTLRARASLERSSGDIRIQLPGSAPAATTITTSGAGSGDQGARAAADRAQAQQAGTTAAGIIAARLDVAADGDQVRADLLWDSARAGVIKASAGTRLSRGAEGWSWAEDAPLSGSVDASLPQVGVWSVLAPPGWRINGSFEARAQLSGNRQAPRWSGTLQANDLAVRSVIDGIDLSEGRLRTTLQGDRLVIDEFSLRGGSGPGTRIAGQAGSLATASSVARDTDGGTLRGAGTLSWGGGIRMDLQAEARALRVSVRTDRQVTLSGTVRARLGDDGRLVLRGDLRTDRAVILLPDDSAPALGSDVYVHSSARDREAALQAQKEAVKVQKVDTAKPPDVLVKFDLGEDFAVQGKGITTRLVGALEIRSTGGLNLPPRVTGEIRTVKGQYRAYSQQLDIESGVIRFNGAMDNPSLDILAMRPNISVRAGVQVTGTAQAPRVRLYSESGLTDAEILSWVVLGRSTASGGAEAALLQQAALALLAGGKGGGSGGVAKKLGLDEIGFKGPGSGNNASAAALTFGKRLSQKLYVTYEHGLSGAVGSIYIFYDLTRRLTLRGQTGANKNGLDLIYTLTYN